MPLRSDMDIAELLGHVSSWAMWPCRVLILAIVLTPFANADSWQDTRVLAVHSEQHRKGDASGPIGTIAVEPLYVRVITVIFGSGNAEYDCEESNPSKLPVLTINSLVRIHVHNKRVRYRDEAGRSHNARLVALKRVPSE